jgi:hypothetical protein
MPIDETDAELREIATVIGDHESRDYFIKPTEHAALYAESAPELSAILRSPAVTTAAETYERSDAKSKERQHRFKTAANRANMLILGTAFCGALVVTAGVLKDPLGAQAARILANGSAIAALVIGAAASAHTPKRR